MKRSLWIWHIVAITIILAITTVLLKDTLGKGFPVQFENYGSYMSKVRFLESNGFVWFTPNWYFGFEIGRYYGPLTTFITYVIGQFIGDSSLVFHLLGFGAYLLMGIGFYAFLQGEFKSRWPALIAIALFLTAHTTVLSNQGFYWEIPRLAGFSLIPVLLILIRRGLERQGSGIAVAVGAGLGIILLFNTLSFIEAVIISGLYIGIKMIQDEKIRSRWIKIIEDGKYERISVSWKQMIYFGLVSILSFLVLSGWWLIPAVLPHGFASFTQIATQHPLKHLVDIGGSVPSYRYYYVSILTLPGILAVAGIVGAFWRRTTISIFALVLFGISLFLVVTGVLSQPGRFIFDGVLALAILSGALIDQLLQMRWRLVKMVAGIIIIATLASTFQTAFSKGADIKVDQEVFRERIEYQVHSRIAALMQKDDIVYIAYAQGFSGGPMSFNLFFPEKAQVRGGFKPAPTNPDSAKIDQLVKSSSNPDELDSLLQQYGVTYLVVNRPQMEERGTFDKLQQRYEVVDKHKYMTILYTGYSKEQPAVSYNYLNSWRILGLLVSAGAASTVCGVFLRRRKFLKESPR